MNSFFLKNKYFFILVLIYFVAELIIAPWGDFPLNDDWSYTKSVVRVDTEGRINIGGWPAMTLATHIVWGYLFTKVFGFSFLVLRASTWVSTLIGLWVFNKLVFRITNNTVTSFIVSLTLLFSPIYFNMTNTFMTDVNFLTLLIICCYFSYDFFTTGTKSSFFLVFFISALLVLVRQYGVIVPACMTFASFFLKEKRFVFVIWSLVLTVAVYLILQWYESYLKTVLYEFAAYKFSGMISPHKRVFWDALLNGIINRYKIILTHVLFYSLPVTVIFLPAILREFGRARVALIFCMIFAGIYFLYKDYPLQVGNVFLDTSVGADTSYETLSGTYKSNAHFFSEPIHLVYNIAKYIFNSISLCVLIFAVTSVFRRKDVGPFFTARGMFLTSLFMAYLVMILITESFFDRYQIPVIGMSLLLFCFLNRIYRPDYKMAIFPLILFVYVSVFGTKDYFTWNEKKWQAYNELRSEKVQHNSIHGGFEIICWNEGNSDSYEYGELHKFDYLIQYQKEDSFAVYKEYPFQRFFPIKRDTLRVFKRVLFAKKE